MDLEVFGAQPLGSGAMIDVAMPSTTSRPLIRNSNSNSNVAGNEITVSAELNGSDAALFARARASCSGSSCSPSPTLGIETESLLPERSPFATASEHGTQHSPPPLQETSTRTSVCPTPTGSSPSKGPMKASSPISSPSASGSDASPANPTNHPVIFQHVMDPQGSAVDDHVSNGNAIPGQPYDEDDDAEEDMDGEEAGPSSSTVWICQWEGCKQSFQDLHGLVTHLDKEHTLTMVKYTCQWEGCCRSMKPFDARYKLVTHLRCHTGEKPYRCNVPSCTRSFSRLENLKLHIRTHTGEKPYMCHYESCCKRFNNTSDRAKHMKTHITRKPYACKHPGCGRSYTDPSSMRKHIKFAHKLKEEGSSNGSSPHPPDSNGLVSRRQSRLSSGSSLPSPHSTPSPKHSHMSSDPLRSPLLAGAALRPSSSPVLTGASTMLSPAALLSVPLIQLPGQSQSAIHSSGAVMGGVTQHGDGLLIQSPATQPHPMLLFLGGGAGLGQDQLMYPAHQYHQQQTQAESGKGRQQPCSEGPWKQRENSSSPGSSVKSEQSEEQPSVTIPGGQLVGTQPNLYPAVSQPLGSSPQSPLMTGFVPTYMRLAPVLHSPLHLANFQAHSKPVALVGSQHHLGLGTSAPVAQYMVPQFMVSGVAQSQPLILSMVPVMSSPHPTPQHPEAVKEHL